MKFDAVSKAYIVAGLRVGKEVEGFVDAYYGPETLREQASRIGSSAAALQAFEAEISRLDDDPRKRYFVSQLTALTEAVAPSEDYVESVERSYGVRPAWTDEKVFADARAALDSALGGAGSLADRLQAHRARSVIAPNAALDIATKLSEDLQRRTNELVELPGGEKAEIELVEDKPWSGYNWYLGDFRSRIELNTDLPILASSLPELVAHEIYCGHHTEQVVKERRWTIERGWGEASIVLLNSPQALVSEGIATNALDVLVPASERADWVAEHCYRPAGIASEPRIDAALSAVQRDLDRAHGNAAIMAHQRGAADADVIAYLVDEALMEPDRARKLVAFIRTPHDRGYIFNYVEGFDTVAAYLAASPGPRAAFRRLLEEHWTPSSLRDATRHELG